MKKEPSNRSDYNFFTKLSTRWNDNDIYGHMNNIIYYALFDTAVNKWLIKNNLIDEIDRKKINSDIPFFKLDQNIVGEKSSSKINKISQYLRKNKSDYLFVSAPENVAWILNIRGFDCPNSPIPNARLIISKNKKIFLISKPEKIKKLLKD